MEWTRTERGLFFKKKLAHFFAVAAQATPEDEGLAHYSQLSAEEEEFFDRPDSVLKLCFGAWREDTLKILARKARLVERKAHAKIVRKKLGFEMKAGKKQVRGGFNVHTSMIFKKATSSRDIPEPDSATKRKARVTQTHRDIQGAKTAIRRRFNVVGVLETQRPRGERGTLWVRPES